MTVHETLGEPQASSDPAAKAAPSDLTGTSRIAPAADPAAERARRYLDLWERNLSHLALHGRTAPGTDRR